MGIRKMLDRSKLPSKGITGGCSRICCNEGRGDELVGLVGALFLPLDPTSTGGYSERGFGSVGGLGMSSLSSRFGSVSSLMSDNGRALGRGCIS